MMMRVNLWCSIMMPRDMCRGCKYKRINYNVAYNESLLKRFSGNKRIAKRVREYHPVGKTFRKDDLGIVELTGAIQTKRIKL